MQHLRQLVFNLIEGRILQEYIHPNIQVLRCFNKSIFTSLLISLSALHNYIRPVVNTALASFTGLIVGAILAYTSKGGGTTSYADITLPDNANTSFGINSPPDDLHLHMSEEDLSHNATFKYSYQGALKDNNRAEPELEEKVSLF